MQHKLDPQYQTVLQNTREELNTCGHGSCRHCAVEFAVEPQTHALIRSFLRQKKEHGGSLEFDFTTRLLRHKQIATGEYNSISMDRGGVDFHTHPAQCLNDDTCALGVPSPMDLQNITLGCLFGTVAHLVYSREGTYVVQLASSLLAKLKSNVNELMLFFAEVDRTFGGLHEEFLKHTREPYKLYSRRFRRVARLVGFRVHLYKGNAIPRIRFECLCSLLESRKAFVPHVSVPVFLEQVLATNNSK